MNSSGCAQKVRAAIAVLLLAGGMVSAQDVTEPALKAAYIYNFALFTDWPDGAAGNGEPLVLCVSGDLAVSDALVQSVKGRQLGGRAVTVSVLGPAGPHPGCHLLYVSGVTAGQAAKFVADLRDVPVLTLSDIDGFTGVGGIAEFFFEHGRLCFRVELAAVRRAGLRISSRLLLMAKPKK
jgi:hypothetical protein